MNGDLAEVNVQRPSVSFSQDIQQRALLGARNLPRHIAQLPEPETPQKMCCGFRNNFDKLEREALGFLSLLRDHDRSASSQCSNLPVDMQHLRFQKRRAI